MPSLCIALLMSLIPGQAAQETEAVETISRVRTMVTQEDPSPPSTFIESIEPTQAVSLNTAAEAQSVPVQLDDAVPLPNPAFVVAGDQGDVVLRPASGDPFFLGFASGTFSPKAGERFASEWRTLQLSPDSDARPTGHTYGFVMFSRRMTPERLEELGKLGCRVLGFHPHYSVKVALLPEAARDIAALPFVRWIGPAPRELKIAPQLREQIESAPGGESIVYINVFESDLSEASVPQSTPQPTTSEGGESNAPKESRSIWQTFGWQHQALEARGIEILEYVAAIRAFRARMPRSTIEEIASLDFVQYILPFRSELKPTSVPPRR